MKFEDHFDEIIGRRLGLPTDGFREDLAARYDHHSRWYHNKGHIVSVIERIQEIGHVWLRAEMSCALVAALYHDAVYVPGWGENERQSARVMHTHLVAMGAKERFIDFAYEAILDTKTHQTRAGYTSKLLIDADLYGLATDKCEYNGRRIRQEFASVPEDQWIAGRKKFLHTFLLREPFFLLPGQDLEATRARENMENELALLIKSDGASEVHGSDSAEG